MQGGNLICPAWLLYWGARKDCLPCELKQRPYSSSSFSLTLSFPSTPRVRSIVLHHVGLEQKAG